MQKSEVEKYRKLLLQERERFQTEREALEEDVVYDDTRAGQSELADYDQHPGDEGTETFLKERDIAVIDSWANIIGRIDEALGKLDRGTYGTCDRCGRDISNERLAAVPYAIFCVECQDIIEGS